MNVALRPRMTVDEFLDWEAHQARKWEFDGWRPVEMLGVTHAHAVLQSNLAGLLFPRLRGTPCRFLGSDMQLRLPDRVRYPDGMILCSPVAADALTVDDPLVVFEILSEGSQTTGRIDKNREYASISSVRRYIMLEQDRIAATVFARAGEDWAGHVLVSGDMLDMPEVGVVLALADLYEGVELPAER